jgi:hypothetical protein
MIIQGADSIIKKGSWKINSGLIKIKIMPEVDVDKYNKLDNSLEELKKDIRNIFERNI